MCNIWTLRVRTLISESVVVRTDMEHGLSWFPPCSTHTLGWPTSYGVRARTSDLLLKYWTVPLKMWLVTKVCDSVSLACLLLLSDLFSSMKTVVELWAALWRGPGGRELRVASGPLPSRNWGPQCNPVRIWILPKTMERTWKQIP